MAWKVDERIPEDLFCQIDDQKGQCYQRPS